MNLKSTILALTCIVLCSSNCHSNNQGEVKQLSLRQKIGQMIVVGFHATKPNEQEAIKTAQKLQDGDIGGVIFFAYNLKDPKQIKSLTTHFNNVKTTFPPLLMIDQEGGRVARLSSKNGFADFKSAKEVVSSMSIDDAEAHYTEMATMVSDAGFNVALGPVVDLEHHPDGGKVNPVIGGIKRAYSADPSEVINYAEAFIKALNALGILTSIKHFPGHGLAKSDSHLDLVDITDTHQPELELAPYYTLIERDQVDMVMTAHVTLRNMDKENPATLSPVIIKKLLRDKGYEGVVITDDLFMGAIQKHYELKDIVLKAVNADVDILLFSGNPAANKGINAEGEKVKTSDTVDTIINIIEEAIANGDISEDRIEQSYQRIIKMKQKI